MAQLVRDIMTSDPVTLPLDASARQAAQAMRDQDIGDVLVTDGDQLHGIVTDRDLVVRGLAERDDLSDVSLREVCTRQPITATPDDDADSAIFRMRQNAVRRIPVVERGRPVGVLSLGDAAIEKDPDSALANISAAPGTT
jgi:CBS domain-containing protein